MCVSVCVKGPLKHHWNRWVDRLSAKKAVLAQNQFDPIWFLLLLCKGLQINQNVQSFPFPVLLSLERVPYRTVPHRTTVYCFIHLKHFFFQFSYRQSVNERKKVNFLESQPPVKIFTFKSILHLFQFDFFFSRFLFLWITHKKITQFTVSSLSLQREEKNHLKAKRIRNEYIWFRSEKKWWQCLQTELK